MVYNYINNSDTSQNRESRNNKKRKSKKIEPINETKIDFVNNKQIDDRQINDINTEKSTSTDNMIDINDIISGVVFSEILGKPRSKKPWHIKL